LRYITENIVHLSLERPVPPTADDTDLKSTKSFCQWLFAVILFTLEV